MTTTGPLASLEAAYLAARTARDHLDVARARGVPADPTSLEAESTAALQRAAEAMALVAADELGLDDEERRALRAMREGLAAARSYLLPGVAAADAAEEASSAPGAWDRLQRTLEDAYGRAAGALPFEGGILTRPQVLARLAAEPDHDRRRALFLALAPLWRAVDGDGRDASPYRGLIDASIDRWRHGLSPIEANARALGVDAGEIEAWAMSALEGWRGAFVEPARAAGAPPVEPWDWWWLAGETGRALADALPLESLLPTNRAYHAALGADLHELGIVFDIHPRPGRPPVPVAFTTFDGRPHRRADGTWSPGRPTILETLVDGGLADLSELVHETGHAVHLAGIRTRPAFADWPDSDALTEALGDLLALDLYEPAWQRRWLPAAAPLPEPVAIRSRYAEIALDAAWAVFEIRLHERPGQPPNDVWTELTSTWLGVAPHPEWSWWAIRGQLVEAPGYMANYAIGAVLAADLREAIRATRGDWTGGDPGWYGWVRDRVYRFGLERSTAAVLRDVLGRPPDAGALRRQLERATRR